MSEKEFQRLVAAFIAAALIAVGVGITLTEVNARNRQAACMSQGGVVLQMGTSQGCLRMPGLVDSLPNWREE